MAPIRDVEWAQVANNNINLHLVDFYIYHSMFMFHMCFAISRLQNSSVRSVRINIHLSLFFYNC